MTLLKSIIYSLYISLAAIILFGSCNAEKQYARKVKRQEVRANVKADKKAKKAKDIMRAFPDRFSGICGELYPPVVSNNTTTTFHPGTTTTTTPEVEVDVSSTLAALLEGATYELRAHLIDSFLKHPLKVKVPCPPIVVRAPDTVFVNHEQVVENTAKIKSLNDSVNIYRAGIIEKVGKLHEMTGKRDWWRVLAWCLMGWMALKIILKLAVGSKVPGVNKVINFLP